MDIIALLPILSQSLDQTTLRQLGIILIALLTMTGRATMRSVAWRAGQRKAAVIKPYPLRFQIEFNFRDAKMIFIMMQEEG